MTGSLRQRKKEATREAIVTQARQLFVEHGYESTGMDEIARAAQVSRTTLFNYFPSKNALLVAMAAHREQAFRQMVEDICAAQPTTAGRIEQIFRRWASYLFQSPHLHHLITSALSAGGRSDAENSAALGGYMQVFRKVLQDGIALGDVRTDYSLESLTQIVVSTMLTASYTLFQGEDEQIEQHFSENAQLIIETISAQR